MQMFVVIVVMDLMMTHLERVSAVKKPHSKPDILTKISTIHIFMKMLSIVKLEKPIEQRNRVEG